MEYDMLNSYVAKGQYERPSLLNIQIAENLFEHLLRNRGFKAEHVSKWEHLGFMIRNIKEGSDEFVIISESPKRFGCGHGYYVIKVTNKGSQNVLQAIHTPSDMHTHRVVFKLLMEGNYLAAAWNTTHRKNVDLAKEPISYCNAFTVAVAKVFHRPCIIQLHAFDATSHGIKADMILSSTKKESLPQHKSIVNLLKSELRGSSRFIILYYPEEIRELGGTLNVNAKLFYDANPSGLFFHVEMSMALRIELRDKQELRKSFSKCFIGL